LHDEVGSFIRRHQQTQQLLQPSTASLRQPSSFAAQDLLPCPQQQRRQLSFSSPLVSSLVLHPKRR
jgi:hypothetical protein